MKKYLNYNFLIRLGIGIIFISHSLAAVFDPGEFVELLEGSFISSLLPMSPETFVSFIVSLNDGIVGLLLISGFASRYVAMWATLWLVGVMIVIGFSFEMVEHLGLILITMALILGDQFMKKEMMEEQPVNQI